MTKIVRRRFAFIGSAEEEQWLNDMASRGFVLTSKKRNVFGFEECRPNEYTILQYFLKADADRGKLLENGELTRRTGLECICVWGQVAYFRKRKGNPYEFDPNNRIKHYKRLIGTTACFIIASVLWCAKAVIDYFSMSDVWPDQWFLPVFDLTLFVLWMTVGIIYTVNLAKIKGEKKAFAEKVRSTLSKA